MHENLFQNKAEHFLVNPQNLDRFLSELSTDAALGALDEILSALDSLKYAELSGMVRFGIIQKVDAAAQVFLQSVANDYLHSRRLSRSEEDRLWMAVYNVQIGLVKQYEVCLMAAGRQDQKGGQLKYQLPLLIVRLLAALGEVQKWSCFRYSAVHAEFWTTLGGAYLLAESEGFSRNPLQIFPEQGEMISPAHEYLKAQIFQVSSLDSLRPQEIDLADRLIAYLLSSFEFGSEKMPGSLFWVDASLSNPPGRMGTCPENTAPGMRFFHPGVAVERLNGLIADLEHGRELPREIDPEKHCPSNMVLLTMRHLLAYWSANPPQRVHDRHPVTHQVSVLHGLVSCLVIFSPEFGGRPAGLPLESWVVDNVSRGGFGVTVEHIKGDWLKVGALLALRSDLVEGWVVAVVRRYHRIGDTGAQVGMATLSRRVACVDLRLRTPPGGIPSPRNEPGLWLQDNGGQGEVILVLPPQTFDPKNNLEFDYKGRLVLLAPTALLEQGSGYEIAQYRATVAAPVSVEPVNKGIPW